MLSNGCLLDIELGLNFAVIGYEDVLNDVSKVTRERWLSHSVVLVPASSSEIQAWLLQNNVRAVMVRPDRYILGTAQSSAELDSISALLPNLVVLAH